jgi:uncharacterized membrane protein YheB (UPF0754 family)
MKINIQERILKKTFENFLESIKKKLKKIFFDNFFKIFEKKLNFEIQQKKEKFLITLNNFFEEIFFKDQKLFK